MGRDGWLRFDFSSSKLDAFREMLAAKSKRLHEVLGPKVTAIMILLQNKIVTDKLSGQILNKQTGLLQSNVSLLPTTDDGTTITGSVAVTGPARSYAAIHTLGTSGRAYEIMSVKAKALRYFVDGKSTFARRVTHPAIPEKPFMWPTLAENEDTIRQELARAVADVLKEK